MPGKVGPVIAQRERVVKRLFRWKEEGYQVVLEKEVLELGSKSCSTLAQPMTAFEKNDN
ncbi:MAG TPA: hypothetical protein VHP63_00965 [candidate division Zixibacteria bacterium]|nr:hypothetical protein [candidate division Zixibacteria bacterium]